MMKKNWRSVMAALLAGAMIVGGAPAAVFAEDSAQAVEETAEEADAVETADEAQTEEAEPAAEATEETAEVTEEAAAEEEAVEQPDDAVETAEEVEETDETVTADTEETSETEEVTEEETAEASAAEVETDAVSEKNADEEIYVRMNIPYSVFEGLEGTAVDAVASATAKVKNKGVAGYTYNGLGNSTDADAKGTAKGVQYVVKTTQAVLDANSRYKKVTDETSYKVAYKGRGKTTEATLKGENALIEADDYAYYVLSETPNHYIELTSDGFSKVQGSVTSISGEATEITYGGHHQTYEIELSSGISGTVAAVQVVTDKLTFWLQPTDGIWRFIEIGWSPKGDLASTNGATLQSYKVYTDKGTYEVAVNEKLKTLYSDSEKVTASLSGLSGKASNLPGDIENAKATVSYTTGSGREAKTTKVVENAAVADGVFDIPADAALEAGKEYTVTVSSDNYIDISATAAYDSTVYVLMNIPYSVFEKNEGTAVDAVASATAKVKNAGLAGATYNGLGNSTDAKAGGTAKGVQYAVKISDASLLSGYTRVTNETTYNIAYSARGKQTTATLTGKAALIEAGDYAYYALPEISDYYIELTASGFGKVQGSVTRIIDKSADITYGGHHQTYEIALPDDIKGSVAAVQVVTDKATFWLQPTDGIWRSLEIGWSPKGDLASTNGATLQSYKVYTDEGIYNVTVSRKLKTLSDSKITAALSIKTGTVANLPGDIADAKATVSYTEGSGRTAVTTTYVKDADITSGKFTIPSGKLTDGTTYTVTVSSSNYIDLSTTAEYTNKNGFVYDSGSKTWKYYKNNALQSSLTSVVKGTIDGTSGWYYVAKGTADLTYTGLGTNKNGTWYLEKGKVNFKKTDVLKVSKAKSAGKGAGWYYIKKGKLTAGPTVAKNKNGWWYITKSGRVDFKYTGLGTNKYGTWYITKGKVNFKKTDVLKVSKAKSAGKGAGWYYIKKGKMTAGPTVAKNKNGWWYIAKNGKVNFKYTGIGTNRNGSWYIKNGKVRFSYSGKKTFNGKTYTIKKGKVTKVA